MYLIANLNHTLLLPYQLLLDISQQLSDDLYQNLKKQIFKQDFSVKTANDWINLESFGHITPLRAQELCETIQSYCTQHAISQLDLYLHLENYTLTSDNFYALLHLCEAVKKLTIHLNTQTYQAIKQTDYFEILSQQKNMIFSICDVQQDQADFNQCLAQLNTARFTALRTLGFHFSPSHCSLGFESPHLIDHSVGYAWTILKLGSYEVASNLLDILLADAQSRQVSEQILMHLQLIRFHSHQYLTVSHQPYPDTFQQLDQSSATYLYYIKAYAATLSRQTQVAETSFKACGIDKTLPLTDEFSLYQLNIFALFNVITQKSDLAYDLELQIESFIQNNQITSTGLKYVNFINLARLYKKQEDFATSLTYYEKAYDEISGGGYTTSDYVYYNMNLGSLYEAAKNPQSALVYWVKAALHWIVAKNPYSLAWRPKIILCNEKNTDLNKVLSLTQAAKFFIEKIKTLLTANDIQHLNDPTDFHFTLNNTQLHTDAGYVSQPLIVYGSQVASTLKYTELKPLNDFLSQVLTTVYRVESTHRTIHIDTLSEDFLRKNTEAWPLSLVHTAKSWHVNQVPVKALLPMSKSPTRPMLFKSRMLTSVQYEDNVLKLHYKRSFMDKVLTDPEEITCFQTIYSKEAAGLVLEIDTLTQPMVSLLYQRAIELHCSATVAQSVTPEMA